MILLPYILLIIAISNKEVIGQPHPNENRELIEINPFIPDKDSTRDQTSRESISPLHTQVVNSDQTIDNSETVGNAPLARARALTARAKAHGFVQRARVRARLHHPLLLAPTPTDLLNTNDTQDETHRNAQNQPNKLFLPANTSPTSSKKSDQYITNSKTPTPLKTNFEHGVVIPQNEKIDIPQGHTRTVFPDARYTTNNYGNYYQSPYTQIQDINLPEIYVHNIDNSEEVYRNQKPGFSIIPTHWKPPPESNLHFQGEYEQHDGQEPVLAILPGKWKDDCDGYDTYCYEDYDVIPISYNMPDYDNRYGRSSETDDSDQDVFPSQFLDMKQQLREWHSGDDSLDLEAGQTLRAADPTDTRHFHDHGHSHTFIHQHNHGPPFSKGHLFHQQQIHAYGSNFKKPDPYNSYGYPSDHHFPIHHPPVSHLETHGASIPPPHGHQLTINKQLTTVIVPPGSQQNVQISQVAGNNNAVSQSQASQNAHLQDLVNPGFLPSSSQNFQSSQISGNQNSVSQSQASHAPFTSRQSDQLVRSPYIVNFPRYNERWASESFHIARKRSIFADPTYTRLTKNISNLLLNQKELFNEIGQAKHEKGMLIVTEIGSNSLDELTDDHQIEKRSVPLLRLLADPNAKLDVPKTLENMGSVVRSSFENKRAPMYHIKNTLGSTKDLFLSVLKIPPQDLLVPSRYKIVDRERETNEIQKSSEKDEGEKVGAINRSLLSRQRVRPLNGKARKNQDLPKHFLKRSESSSVDPYGYSDTYKKIGSMVRESVRSGQEALNHVGELYHSARKAFASTRHALPRVLLSSARIPAVQRPTPLRAQNDNLLVITPKILQLKQESVGAPHYSENFNDFVGVEQVLNSVGISDPNAQKVDMRRIVLHGAPKNVNLERKLLRERLDADQDANRNLQKYFVLSDTLKQDNSEDVGETLLALENAKETVGASNLRDFILQMKNGFLNLFKSSLTKAKENIKVNKVKGKVFIEPSGNPPAKVKIQLEKLPTSKPASNVYKFLPEATSTPKRIKNDKLLEFRRYFNLQKEKNLKNSNSLPSKANEIGIKNTESETVGAGLPLPRQLLKPFMGQPSKSERRKFFEDYGDSIESSEEEKSINESTNRNISTVVGAINPILFNKSGYNMDTAFKYLAHHFRTHENIHNTTLKDTRTSLNYSINTIKNNQTTFTVTTEIPENYSTVIYKTLLATTTTTEAYNATNQDFKYENSTDNNKAALFETNNKAVLVNNETKTSEIANTRVKVVNATNLNNTDSVGISMNMGKALLTPFMGKIIKKEHTVDGYKYNNNNEYELQYVRNTNTEENNAKTMNSKNYDGQNLNSSRNVELEENKNISRHQFEDNVI